MFDWETATWCERAAWLRGKYFALLSGEAEEVVRARGPNAEDEVKFTKANLSQLLAELRNAEAYCAAESGTTAPGRRRAFRIGSRRAL